MDRKNNKSILNISGSFVSPNANSTKIVIPTSLRPNKRKPTSPLSSKNAMSKTSLGTMCYNRSLDPQVLSDITSQGLTSRISRYTGGNVEDSQTKNNSLRSTFVKNNPFPVIKFRTNGNKLSPQRSLSLSSVRIAPPEKVVFQPNLRSNILRSGSLANLPSTSNVKRSDNEPLNPASHEPDSNPTRSVLDALKEISRKRINNEELDAERIKKQCKDMSEVDGSDYTVHMSEFYRNPVIQKRPRESGTSQQTSPQSIEAEKQKKRFCTKNNEVLSSLSSSLSLITPKRSANQLNTPKGFDFNKVPPEEITSVENLPQQPISEKEKNTGVIKKGSNVSEEIIKKNNSSDTEKNCLSGKPKPKITLFNVNYDDKAEIVPLKVNEFTDRQVRFVKPRECVEEFENKIKNMKKVEQRQLALLLECLAEELTDKDDVVDAPVAETNVVQIDTKNNNLQKLQETPNMPLIQPIPSQTLSNKDEQKEKESNQENSTFNKPQPISSAPQTETAPVKPLFSFGSTTTTSVPSTLTTKPTFSIPSSTSTTVIASSASNSLISTNTLQSNLTTSPPKPAIQSTNNSSFLFGNISNKESLAKPLISSPTTTFTTTGINFNTGSSKESQSTLIPEQKNIGTTSFATPATPVFEQLNQTIVKPILSTTTTSSILTPTIAATTTGFSFTPNNTFNLQNTSSVPVFGNLTTTASVPKTNPITTTASALATSAFTIPATTTKFFENFSSPNNMPSFTQSSAQPVALSSVSTSKSAVCNTTSSSFFNTPQNTTSVFGQTSIFGQNTNVNNNNTLNVNQTTGGFSFKSPPIQQASTQQQQPITSIGGSGGFSFTANTNAPQVSSSDSGKTSVFSRLGPVSTTSNTTTAVVSPSKNLFTFSNVSQPNTVTTTASGFGNISNVSNISQTSSIFGGNTSLNNTTQNTAIFGNNNLFSNQNTPSIFGQQTPNNNKVTATENKSTFSFSSSLANPQTTTNITNPTFSTNNNNNTSSPFTFGQTSSLNNKPFAFGGDPNANVANQQTNQSSLPKFNFSTGSNSVFGGNNNTNNNSAPIFGTSTLTPSSSGAFNFTGNNNNNNTNNLVFGSGSTGGSSASPGGAFNFTAPVVPQTGGLAFNIGTGGSQSQNRRPIRQATRRLNK